MPLDPNAASVHPIVTIPFALAIARRATPPRPALRPSHLVPSVCRPAPRRTFSFPSRRAGPTTGAIGASIPLRLCPAHGPVTIGPVPAPSCSITPTAAHRRATIGLSRADRGS